MHTDPSCTLYTVVDTEKHVYISVYFTKTLNILTGRNEKDSYSCLLSERSGLPGNLDHPFHIVRIAERLMQIADKD